MAEYMRALTTPGGTATAAELVADHEIIVAAARAAERLAYAFRLAGMGTSAFTLETLAFDLDYAVHVRITPPDLARLLGQSRQTIWSRIRRGVYPQPVNGSWQLADIFRVAVEWERARAERECKKETCKP